MTSHEKQRKKQRKKQKKQKKKGGGVGDNNIISNKYYKYEKWPIPPKHRHFSNFNSVLFI